MDEQEDVFEPDWYSPPGDTIKHCMQRKKMSREDFALQMEMSEEAVSQLLSGDGPITLQVADKLAKVIGSTSDFWCRRESNYRRDKARIELSRQGKLEDL